MVNKILDGRWGQQNVQIYRRHGATLGAFDNDTRPTPVLGPIARRLGPLESFERGKPPTP